MPDQNDDVLDNPIEIVIPVPVPGEIPMAGENALDAYDIDEDAYAELLEEGIRSNEVIMMELQGNTVSESSLVNHAAGKKFSAEDAIEAASVEYILQLQS